MALWILAFIISLLLTLGMGVVFAFISMVALNGFMSMKAAMPTFLVMVGLVWPFMVAATTFSTWLVFTIAKLKQPFRKILFLNIAIVTTFLLLLILAASVL